jgi:hypothetical protein
MVDRNPRSNADSFNFRVDPALKRAFIDAAESTRRPAAQVLRELMRAYVRHRQQRALHAEARRQSLVIAQAAGDPYSEESAVMRELEAAPDDFAAGGDERQF